MHRQSTRLIVVAVAALVALVSGTGRAQERVVDPALAAAEQAARQAVALAPFVGGWAKHGATLLVNPDGSAEHVWRTYTWCGPGIRPPCDVFRGNEIVSGGYAAYTFATVDGQTAYGTIGATAEPVALRLEPDGTALLVSGPALSLPPAAWVSPRASTRLCRPDAWQFAQCGA